MRPLVWLASVCVAPLSARAAIAEASRFKICYEPLCEIDSAYFIEDIGETEVFLGRTVAASSQYKTCISHIGGLELSELFCNQPYAHRITISRALKGLISLFLVNISQDGTTSAEFEKTVFVRPLKSRPSLDLQLQLSEPQFGSIQSKSLNISYTYTWVESEKRIDLERASATATLNFAVANLAQFNFDLTAGSVFASNVEPGSWFLTLTPTLSSTALIDVSAHYSSEALSGYPSSGFIDFVLSPLDIYSERRFSSVWKCGNGNDYAENYSGLLESGGEDKDRGFGNLFGALFDGEKRRAKEAAKAACKAYTNSHYGKNGKSKSGSIQRSDSDSEIVPSSRNVHVCIWGSNKMDGQKRIWLQQVDSMDSSEFRFTWVLTSSFNESVTAGTVHARLVDIYARMTAQGVPEDRRVRVMMTPYNGVAVPYEVLQEDPGDGTEPFGQRWDGKEAEVYRYAADRLRKANFNIDIVTPMWARDMFVIMREHLLATNCDVVVYGNERGFSSDVLIRDVARSLGVPTVVELLNLFMSPDMAPDAIVAPSTYAAQHDSIRDLTLGSFTDLGVGVDVAGVSQEAAKSTPIVEVIPPAVDVARFNASALDGPPIQFHPDCVALRAACSRQKSTVNNNNNNNKCVCDCITIGFMARLSPEKNAALFLTSAHALLQTHPLARFTIIGDGPIRDNLEELAEMLDITWAVKFTGWIDAELPRVLAAIDVMVNPSIRGWSETFCIANIESMSMGIPLVTFAVGGIGEYVDDPGTTVSAYIGSSGPANYTVTSNAVIVNIASPYALAQAVARIADDSSLRASLSRAGKRTVQAYFTVDRQMRQYAQLYKMLATRTTRA